MSHLLGLCGSLRRDSFNLKLMREAALHYGGPFVEGNLRLPLYDCDLEEVEGIPFRTLNDGVTPVLIGGNDWAAAWATNAHGQHLFPVGRGFAGERQREIAYRFGINLVMHVLSGNYKSDQVHVPALLDRLGQ